MKIIDSKTAAPYVRPSMFLHGLTGRGKSTWAVTGGRPLVIVTEPKAASVLLQINPDALGLVPESLDDLDALFQFLGDPSRVSSKNADRIVLDSFTELTMAMPRWIQARAGKGSTSVATRLELSEYGDLRDYSLALVKAIQLTGLPSVIIGRSVSKKVGRSEVIVPDALGKSVDELPGKLLPTAEARHDEELGWVIDTTPVDYSQRCGLPWVPQLWTGTCLDYLATIEKRDQATAPKAEEKPTNTPTPEPAGVIAPPAPVEPTLPPEPPAAWVEAVSALNFKLEEMGADPTKRAEEVQLWMNRGPEALSVLLETIAALDLPTPPRLDAPDPETQPEEYRKAFGKVATDLEAEKRAKAKAKTHAQEVEEFVDGVSPAPAPKAPEESTVSVEFVTAEEAGEIQDLVNTHKLPDEGLRAYCVSRDRIVPFADGKTSWLRLKRDSHGPLLGALKTENGRRAMVAAANTYRKEA
jgi:hypothetical protein